MEPNDSGQREYVRLKSGLEVVLRPIMAADRELLVEGFERLSSESRYRRFFTDRQRLTADEVTYLTDVDHEAHVAIGAGIELPDGTEVGIGVARFIIEEPDPFDGLPDDRQVADAAVVVVDDYQGLGLGKILFQRLTQEAAARGIECLKVDVLADNDAMRQMMERLFGAVNESEEDGIVTLELPVQPAPAAAEDPRSLAYELLRMVAAGAVRLRHWGAALQIPTRRGSGDADEDERPS